jgi:hypothetical protein
MKRVNLQGQKFGRLTVVRYHDSIRGRSRWECACECGRTKIVPAGSLRGGGVRSCGCWLDEVRRALGRRGRGNYKDGRTGTPTYESYQSMMGRCYIMSAGNYSRYGGRGIRVCERWHSFENFLADMGERPAGMSIDRIDPNGNYEPGNCRWATAWDQQRHKREQTHCKHGHEFTSENTYVATWHGQQMRQCKQCRRNRQREGRDRSLPCR